VDYPGLPTNDVETYHRNSSLENSRASRTPTVMQLQLNMPFIYLFCLLHAGSSQVDDVIAGAITSRTSGGVKPEIGSGVEVWWRRATRVARCAETGWSCGIVRRRRRWWSADEDPVIADQIAGATAAVVGRCRSGEMTALGVSGLTTPLDASVLKPDFDLCLDETQLSGKIAPADHPSRMIHRVIRHYEILRYVIFN